MDKEYIYYIRDGIPSRGFTGHCDGFVVTKVDLPRADDEIISEEEWAALCSEKMEEYKSRQEDDKIRAEQADKKNKSARAKAVSELKKLGVSDDTLAVLGL